MDQLAFYRHKLAYEIDSADLHDALGRAEPVIVVDGRAAGAYTQEHIPTAINLPHRTIDAESTGSLDRSKLYVCYCDGIGCNASTKTALNLLELGFQVRELIGGLDWWRREGYAIHAAKAGTETGIRCGC